MLHTPSRDSGGKTRSERCHLHEAALDSVPAASGKCATNWPCCASRKKPWSSRARPWRYCHARPQHLQQAFLRVSPTGCPSLPRPASAIRVIKERRILQETHRRQEASAAAQAVAEALRKILKGTGLESRTSSTTAQPDAFAIAQLEPQTCSSCSSGDTTRASRIVA